VQIEDARSTRHQNQIGGLSGDYGGVGAMRGCVDNRQGRTSLVVSRALAIRLGCRDVTLGVSLSRLSAYVAEEACGSTSRTAMLRLRRSTATDRCSVIGLQSAVASARGQERLRRVSNGNGSDSRREGHSDSRRQGAHSDRPHRSDNLHHSDSRRDSHNHSRHDSHTHS
jgi:hypothetical protein